MLEHYKRSGLYNNYLSDTQLKDSVVTHFDLANDPSTKKMYEFRDQMEEQRLKDELEGRFENSATSWKLNINGRDGVVIEEISRLSNRADRAIHRATHEMNITTSL